ncbi:MAG TPA: hypothetical protein DHV62_03335, partial [Elusimicrobia bacterium]|nr:hypothetical protein [Elusimicrobiota bacterium]
GAYDYIAKPFNIDELTTLIEKVLEKKELKFTLALYETSRAVFSSLKLDDLLNIIVDLSIRTFRADEVSIMLYDEQEKLYLAASSGFDGEIEKEKRLTLGQIIAEKTKQTRAPLLLVEGFGNYPEFNKFVDYNGTNSAILFPIIRGDNLLGLINLTRTQTKENFSQTDLQMVSVFVAQISQAIENAHLYKKLEEKITELKEVCRNLEISQAKLIQSEKLAALGQLAGGAAHELNNPLSGILGFAQILINEIPNDIPWKNDLKEIEKSAQRCKKIIASLLSFSRQSQFDFKPANVNEVIEETLKLCEHQITLANVKIVRNYAQNSPFINASTSHLQQVFLNIIVNAQQAMPKGGTLTINTYFREPDSIEISFIDTGIGIEKENLKHIFEPFFTTKEVGKGTGLGLSVSHGIIQKHQGNIRVESEGKDKGAKFVITLPILKG